MRLLQTCSRWFLDMWISLLFLELFIRMCWLFVSCDFDIWILVHPFFSALSQILRPHALSIRFLSYLTSGILFFFIVFCLYFHFILYFMCLLYILFGVFFSSLISFFYTYFLLFLFVSLYNAHFFLNFFVINIYFSFFKFVLPAGLHAFIKILVWYRVTLSCGACRGGYWTYYCVALGVYWFTTM